SSVRVNSIAAPFVSGNGLMVLAERERRKAEGQAGNHQSQPCPCRREWVWCNTCTSPKEECMAGAELTHVLDGYKVLDFTQVLAGPTVTRLMAEMGAEILKVELAPSGGLSRALPFLKDGRSAYFIQQNRGKKSLCLDAKNPKGL